MYVYICMYVCVYIFIFCTGVSSHMCPQYIPPQWNLIELVSYTLVLRPWGLGMLNKYLYVHGYRYVRLCLDVLVG